MNGCPCSFSCDNEGGELCHYGDSKGEFFSQIDNLVILTSGRVQDFHLEVKNGHT